VLLLLWILGTGVAALVFHVWAAAIAAGILLPAALVGDVAYLRLLVKGESLGQRRPHLPLGLSRAQQFAAAMVLIGVPVIVWRVVEDGWVAVAIYGPLLAVWVLWMVTLVRREGWRGQRASRD
jgi:hypothetical protein